MLQDIDLLSSSLSLVFVHQYREANFAADILAKKAANDMMKCTWLQNTPSFFVAILSYDVMGRAFPRLIFHYLMYQDTVTINLEFLLGFYFVPS